MSDLVTFGSQNQSPDATEFAEKLDFLVKSADYQNSALQQIMATQSDLDAAIAALPGAIQTALAPVIASIQAKAAGTPIDFSPEIASLNAIPAAVASAVTPAPTPTPAPAS